MSELIKATAALLVDDERVIATQWTMPPGSETGYHVHGHNYVVVYLAGGVLTVDTGNGEIQAPIEKHALTSRPAGIAHNVMNKSDQPIAFIEIEIK